MTDMNKHVVWVCHDCLHHHANGECSSCPGELCEPHDREPLSLIEREPEGSFYTLGLPYEEHSCGQEITPGDPAENCECDTKEFSWEQCGGCGTQLGGSRHALVLWTPQQERKYIVELTIPDDEEHGRVPREQVRDALERACNEDYFPSNAHFQIVNWGEQA